MVTSDVFDLGLASSQHFQGPTSVTLDTQQAELKKGVCLQWSLDLGPSGRYHIPRSVHFVTLPQDQLQPCIDV